ncbi:hypothetical protein L6Q96_01470 [Candidatus Binatia bacterium]|nr:hypothetical protein [Candidatus Binatia bacterium]
MEQKIRFGVLWKNTTREGNRPYLSGRVDLGGFDAAVELLRSGGRFLVLSNKKRPDKRDPDCVLWVVPETPTPGSGDTGSGPARPDRRPAGGAAGGAAGGMPRSRGVPGGR